MKSKFKVNIDRLELCYTAPLSVVEELTNIKYQEADGFRLLSIDKGETEIKTYLQVDVRETDTDGSLCWRRYAELSIGSTFERAEAATRYVWLSLYNNALYTPIYPDTPILSYVYYIADALSLSFNNITKLEVATDTNINYFYRVKKAIRDKALTPIVLGRAYADRKQIIDALLYVHTGDRLRYRTGSLYVKDKEKSIELNIYDKSREIEESGKDYIKAWDSLPHIYRLETRVNNKALKEYAHKTGRSLESIYLGLLDKGLLFDMFLYFSDRAIHFRQGRGSLNILQL